MPGSLSPSSPEISLMYDRKIQSNAVNINIKKTINKTEKIQKEYNPLLFDLKFYAGPHPMYAWGSLTV